MLRRRIVVYFVLATVVSVVAAVFFAWRASDRAIAETRKDELLFARSVARFVGGLVEREGRRLEQMLAGLPTEAAQQSDARRHLQRVKAEMLGASGIWVLDGNRDTVASIADPGGLPPQSHLFPALRSAADQDRTIVTDVWVGLDDKPHIALVRAHGTGEAWRVAVASVQIDSPEFLRAFGYFLVDDRARLQVLDSTGVAIFSTRENDRYRSVVHGTYFSDAVREGKATQLSCHSCHEDGSRNPERDTEVMTLAPVISADWSVTIRKSTDDIVAARRGEVFSHFGLVSVVLGAFLGFFLMLRRHVLKPMRELSKAAAQLSYGSEEASEVLARDDEFAVLAQSFEAMRGEARGAGAAESESGLGGGNGAAEGNGARHNRPLVGEPGPTLESAMQSSAAYGKHRDKETERALTKSLDAVFADIVGVGPVRSILVCAEIGRCGKHVVSGRGVALSDAVDNGLALVECTRPRRIVPVETIAEECEGLQVDEDTKAFYVHDLRVGDVIKGRLFIGLGPGYESAGSYLGSTLSLFASQIASLIDRGYLYERLRTEHAQKNRMLGHLFEAEAEERKRIARGIHDQMAQDLTALLLLLETFPDDPAKQTEVLERAKARVGEILDGTDRLIRRLRPAVLDDLGLVEAIRAIGFNLLEPAGISFDFSTEGEGLVVPKRVEVAVFRVIQEAATNIVRHSGAKRVTASLEIKSDRIECIIADDGRGMDLSWLDDAGARPRWGVLGMRERITQMGGLIMFSTPAGGGVQIDIEVPFALPALAGEPERRMADARENHPG